MLTFNQIYAEVQAQTQDTDASSLVVIKRGINQGMHKFGDVLNRDWRVTERTFDVKSTQQFYQMPEDAIRIKSLVVTVGNINYPLTEIVDEEVWQQLNMRTQSSTQPQFYYVKGADQYGIWPKPSANQNGGGLLEFEREMRDMTQDDYSTGTIALTNASAAVVGTSTIFTSAMVGRTLVPDPTGGTGDGRGYKIASFTDATHVTLENTYSGPTTGSTTYLIGEVPDIPAAFHEALIDYSAYRYYRRRRDLGTAKDLKAAFDEALLICEQNYSSKSSSQYFRRTRVRTGYSQYKRDLTIP